jgi:hypothetical protein
MQDASLKTDRASTWSRRIPWLVIIAAYFAFPNARPDFYWNWNDPASYVLLSYKLWYFGEYNIHTSPSNDIYWVWPPGYPVMLLPAVVGFGRSLLALKLLMTVYSLLTLVGITALFKPRLGIAGASTVALYTSLNIHWFIASHQTMAEIPTALFCILGLLSARNWVQAEQRSAWRLLLAVMVGSAACYVRGYGLCLIPAVVVYIVRHVTDWPTRLRMVLAYCLPVTTIGLSWFVLAATHPQPGYGGRGSLEMVTRSEKAFGEGLDAPRAGGYEIVDRMFKTVKWFGLRWTAQAVLPVLESFDPDFSAQPWRAIRFGLCILVVWTWSKSVLCTNQVEDYFVAFFVLLTLFIAGGGLARYWVPLIPFFVGYIAIFLRSVATRSRLRIVVILALVVTTGQFLCALRSFELSPYEDPRLGDFVAVVDYADAHMPDDASLASHHMKTAWLLTGRRQFHWTQGDDLAALPQPLYVVVWDDPKQFGGDERDLLARVQSSREYTADTLFQVSSHRLVQITRHPPTTYESDLTPSLPQIDAGSLD